MDAQTTTAAAANRVFLTISFLTLAISICCGQLITRLYFVHGGRRKWFSSWLQTGGWPIILVPLLVAYTRRRRKSARTKLFYIKPRAVVGASVIGTLAGLTGYLYMYGASQLPVSTSSLILASQLAFTAVFTFLLVRQKFTAYTVNSIVLMTLSSVILGIHMGGDRPAGETSKAYLLGFFMTVASSALSGLGMPLVELTYKKAKQDVTFTVVMEIQLVITFVATVFCTVGMLVNSDFQAIAGEARAYDLGETIYYVVIVSNAISCQMYFLGALGIIFYSSSLRLGIITALLLPVTEVLAVIVFREKFRAEKGLSLFLSLFGFVSYIYGEFKQNNNKSTDKNMNDQNHTREESESALQTTVAP